MLSFFHKPQKNVSEKFYYAFTFPYTYTECQDQLKIYDGLFEKSMDDLEYLVCRLNNNDRKANTPMTPANQIGDGKFNKNRILFVALGKCLLFLFGKCSQDSRMTDRLAL